MNSSTERPKKVGGLQRAQQESRKKWQEMMIVSTRQEEFLLQSTVTWERLWEQKKGQLSRFQEMKEESPRPGERKRRTAYLLSLLLAIRGVVVEK